MSESVKLTDASARALPRPRASRLRKDSDIRAVFEHGKTAHSRNVSVYCLSSPTGTTRTAVVAGRKVGGAVQRNLAKRRLRAAIQQSRLPDGYDVVVVARPRCLLVPFGDLRSGMAEQVRRCARSCQASQES